MAMAQLLTKIGILLGSFLMGLLFYYVTHPSSNKLKKQQIDMVASQLINFVIYIWIGKVIIHSKLFIQDPLAVLAYPSNSQAVIVATILFILTISYQAIRKKMNVTSFVAAFVPVFLAASFIYEFIQQTIHHSHSFMHLGLLMILLVVYILGNKRFTAQLVLLMAWAAGQFVMSFFAPFVLVFGYILPPYFLLGIIGLCLALYVYNRRKKVL